MSRILFVYPGALFLEKLDGAASRLRLQNIAWMTARSGWETHILALSAPGELDSKREQDGVHYHLLEFNRCANANRSFTYKLTHFFDLGRELASIARRLDADDHFDAVVLFSTFWKASGAFLKMKKKCGWKLGILSNEWHSLKGKSMIEAVNLLVGRNFYYPKMDFALTATSWLSEKHKSILKCLVVPPIFETEYSGPSEPQRKDGILTVGYAGNCAGGKDRIDYAVEALDMLSPEEQKKLCFRLYGVKKEMLERLLGEKKGLYQKYSGQIELLSFMPMDKLHQELRNLDFTLLFRPDAKYSRAGFAGKMGESMILGIPMIANLTGDMGYYLHDGIEGLVAEDESPAAISKAFCRALSLSQKELVQMRHNAYQRGLNSFSRQGFSKEIQNFLNNL